MDYFLTSARLGFRCWRDDDLPLATELWGDPEVTRKIGGPFTPEMVCLRLEEEIAEMQEHRLQYWPIFLLDSNQHVGCAGLRPYREERRIYELGVHLRRAFWRQGLASEAARAVIAYAFDVGTQTQPTAFGKLCSPKICMKCQPSDAHRPVDMLGRGLADRPAKWTTAGSSTSSFDVVYARNTPDRLRENLLTVRGSQPDSSKQLQKWVPIPFHEYRNRCLPLPQVRQNRSRTVEIYIPKPLEVVG